MCDQVGIIERGQLLITGAVEEIRRRLQPHREVKARVLGGGAPLGLWLGLRDDVANVKVEEEFVRFSHQGELNSEAALLREMVQADFAVVEFGSHSQSLEDVFLAVTKGIVQ